MTKTMTTAGGIILMAVVLATVVESQPASGLDDVNFEPSADNLRQALENVSIVQPTHFSKKTAKIKHQRNGDSLVRAVGRNVTFRDLIAEAYDCSPGHVILPPDAPEGGFDFLVTVSPNTRKHLRMAIEKQLGFTAASASQDTDVMILQVKDPALPGFSISTNNDDSVDYDNGKLYFTDQPISVMTKGLEDGLALPVVDQTGLTNNYDFSVAWSGDTTQAMRDGKFDVDGVQKALNAWGFELKPDRQKMEMVTVNKAH